MNDPTATSTTVSGLNGGTTYEFRVVATSGAKILCERHNSALSTLDTAAGQLFRALHHYQADLRENPEPHGNEFALFHGDLIERWMLKLFWGALAAGSLGKDGGGVEGLRSDIDLRALAAILYRGEPLPDGWGLYVAGRPEEPFSGEADVVIQSITGPDGSLTAGLIEFGAVAFQFCFGTPGGAEDIEFHRHPSGLFLQQASTSAQKVIALAWDDGGSDPVILTRVGDGTIERRR